MYGNTIWGMGKQWADYVRGWWCYMRTIKQNIIHSDWCDAGCARPKVMLALIV